jgi:hypothetical protein
MIKLKAIGVIPEDEKKQCNKRTGMRMKEQ